MRDESTLFYEQEALLTTGGVFIRWQHADRWDLRLRGM